MSFMIILFMTFTVNWPDIKAAVPVARKYLDQNGGFYYEILDDSGGQTYARMGNPQSQRYVIEFVNVPADRVGLLENWLLDIWNWWMATSTSPANADNLEALYKKASIVIQPKDLLSAHAHGKPLTPEQSANYVVHGENVFSGNVFEKNQQEYEEYLRKHVPGYSKQEVIQDINSYIHNLEVMNKEAYANHISMLEDLVRYLEKGQISPQDAKKQALRIYNNAISYRPHGEATEVPKSEVTTARIIRHHETDRTSNTRQTKVVTVTVTSHEKTQETNNTNESMVNKLLSVLELEQLEKDKTKKEYTYVLLAIVAVIVIVAIYRVIR